MAKRDVEPPEVPLASLAVDQARSSTPNPPDTLHVSLTTLSEGAVLHRVHQDLYRPDQFNPGRNGNARFSPIRDAHGNPIPTLYGGSTFCCTLMETVFHDVPHTPGFKTFDRGKLSGQVHSTVEVHRKLDLVDLSSVALRKMGVTRRELIDSEQDQYPITRKWAEAIHRQCAQAQGLFWVSRQDDSARAVVLFGDRIGDGCVKASGKARGLWEDPRAYEELLMLAERLGVDVVPGRM